MSTPLELLRQSTPFQLLPDDKLVEIARFLKKVVHPKEKVVYHQNYTRLKGIDIVAEGEYESFFYDEENEKKLVRYYLREDVYGGLSLLFNQKKSIRTVIAKKGTVVYFLPQDVFRALTEEYEAFADYFSTEFGREMLDETYASYVRIRSSELENYAGSDIFFSKTLRTLALNKIYSCPPDTPIYRAAQIMTTNRIGCLFIKDGKEFVGYLTDIILRENVVGGQVDTALPVTTVMGNPIFSISLDAFIYEAILLMFKEKIRYLLVEDGGQYVGVMNRNKLLTEQSYSPFVFIQSVRLANTLDELRNKWNRVPSIVFQLLSRGVKAENVNQVITSVSDYISVRIIESALKEMGAPPAKFVFMALGSEGRKEQTLKTDQDNAIIYEDTPPERREEVRAYFLRLAEIISEQLDYVGFSFCTGGFMAKNPRWNHSLSHWKANYEKWMNRPAPESVMNFATFFDCRMLYGDATLFESLREFIGEKLTEHTPLTYYHFGENALKYEPPLTFFNFFRTFSKGEEEVLNIKKAMTPIVDLVRLYSLKYGVFKTNTGERLEELYHRDLFKKHEYYELMQAYYYMMALRLTQQAKTIIRKQGEPNNYIAPGSLTKIEQVTLKEIFKIIEKFQTKIRIEFTGQLK
ncbi:CBS domain-containing protein [Catalinimonas alkaloidigena]|uniref:CBS domain-containing protein n=1 Tax=Catalinimonas alkaloidigena TaxID=1075417 RepID=A0A1G9IX17_9BACT|nr:DUF294 nucleotidyltransferase-like domain-containing protein [Catalinimonas alkaloidigena]SDL29394.1 CBS domain-containing protein [Catalinimonas alkaloidigena]